MNNECNDDDLVTNYYKILLSQPSLRATYAGALPKGAPLVVLFNGLTSADVSNAVRKAPTRMDREGLGKKMLLL